ncbi:MAG: hypothetical protein JOS17DRAFT_778332 [Linnemannia elongata]|nr:MAG: hypothetical protein JOS17DRAFT_778332 [Linnemannia elongata]
MCSSDQEKTLIVAGRKLDKLLHTEPEGLDGGFRGLKPPFDRWEGESCYSKYTPPSGNYNNYNQGSNYGYGPKLLYFLEISQLLIDTNNLSVLFPVFVFYWSRLSVLYRFDYQLCLPQVA